jgi:ABC-type nitrate/sulfonate/bicarbonate transport system permease component
MNWQETALDAIDDASRTPTFRSAGRTLSPRAQAWVFGCAGALVALGVWTLLSHVLATGGGVINRLPTPARVLRELEVYLAGDFPRDLLFSLRVFAIGWVVGAVCATLVGLVLGRVRLLGQIFIPVIEAIRPVSSIAWVPLAVVWFGFGCSWW